MECSSTDRATFPWLGARSLVLRGELGTLSGAFSDVAQQFPATLTPFQVELASLPEKASGLPPSATHKNYGLFLWSSVVPAAHPQGAVCRDLE